MTDEGNLEEKQGELVHSALSFGEITCERILTARVDMAAVELGTPVEEIMELIRTQRHSRFPVYEGSVDNIIGVLPIRRCIRAYLSQGEGLDLRALLDKPHFVHQSTHIDELLAYMSSHKTNLVVVTDHYGGTVGVVTVEDILEELVGEIWDEDDEVVEKCARLPDGSFSFDAGLSVEEALDYMDYGGEDMEEYEHKLLGEWAYEHFDLIPRPGDSFSDGGLTVTVSQMENRRIRTLRVSRAEEGGRE